MDISSKVESGVLAPSCDLDKFSFFIHKIVKTKNKNPTAQN